MRIGPIFATSCFTKTCVVDLKCQRPLHTWLALGEDFQAVGLAPKIEKFEKKSSLRYVVPWWSLFVFCDVGVFFSPDVALSNRNGRCSLISARRVFISFPRAALAVSPRRHVGRGVTGQAAGLAPGPVQHGEDHGEPPPPTLSPLSYTALFPFENLR